MVAFTHVGMNPNRKNDCTATIKSLPMIGHAATKNSFVKPFGPETLSFGRERRACWISGTVTGPTNTDASSLEDL